MNQLAYDVRAAAQATSLSEHAINLAINERRLPVRDLDGVKIILCDDIKEWLRSLPKD